MGTQSYKLLVLLTWIFTVHLAVAQSGPSEALIGSWTLDYSATFSKMESRMRVAMDSIPQAQRAGIENSYRGRIMVFGADGGFRMLFPDGREAGGQWSLDRIGGMLVLTDPNGHHYPHRVRVLTDRGLVLAMEDSGDSRLFVKELYFIKN